jgi:uncharacterized protein YggE
MKKRSILPLVTTIVAAIASMSSSSWAKNPDLKSEAPNQKNKLAQLYYPPVSDRQGIMVFGQGQVRLPADRARIELTLVQASTPSTSKPTPTPKPITKQSLQPIVDAIAAWGVPAKDIEVNVEIKSTTPVPFNFTKPKISFEVDKPNRTRVATIINQLKDVAKEKAQVSVEAVNVGYAVKDCQSITTAAYQAAIKDARLRADAIATALKVKLSEVPTVSESFFYDIVVPLCVSETGQSVPLPLGYGELRVLPPYNPEAPTEVQLRRDLFVTYPIKEGR